MPAPQFSLTFGSQVNALNQQEIERRAREARMENALGILSRMEHIDGTSIKAFTRFVRRTAREGLGRDG